MGYETDLTDEQWAYIEPILTYRSPEDLRNGGRPRRIDLRQVVNALLYQARTGVQWRLIPKDFPHHATVRYYFDKWTWDETLKDINTALREYNRERKGRSAQPTA